MLLRKDRKAAAKSLEVFDAIKDKNVLLKFVGKVCGGEMIPAVITASMVVGSRLHSDKELRSMGAGELIKLVMEVAVGIEKEFYGDFHRRTFGESVEFVNGRAGGATNGGESDGEARVTPEDIDERMEELDRILAQQSLDDEPEKSGE